jgi:hypothetical protein
MCRSILSSERQNRQTQEHCFELHYINQTKEQPMNHLCVIGKYKRGWHGIFPDFAGEIIVGASTQKALEAKLANVLGAHLQAIGHQPKPRFKTL